MPDRATAVPWQTAAARDTALATGDGIAAAMTLVTVQAGHIRFNGYAFDFTCEDHSTSFRLDPAIKIAAIEFGLDQLQVERFYIRVVKRIARFLSRTSCH